MPDIMKSNQIKLIFGLLLLVAIVCVIAFVDVKSATEQFFTYIQDLGFKGVLIFGGAYVLACVFFIPGLVLTLGAGFAFGVVKGSIIVSIASTLGAGVAFLLGRTLLRGLIESKVATNQKFSAIDSAVEKKGFLIVFLTRLSPVIPFNFLNYAYGLTKVSFKHYLFASWIGMMPGTIMYVYFGSAVKSLADIASGNVDGGAGKTVLFIVGLIATVVVTVYVTKIAKSALDEAVAMETIDQDQPNAQA